MATSDDFFERARISYQKESEDFTRVSTLSYEHPYCLPLYILLAKCYLRLDYPDLASGAAYKALLLADAVQDDSDEFHEQAVHALTAVRTDLSSDERDLVLPAVAGEDHHREDSTVIAQKSVEDFYLPLIYQLLIRGIFSCGCYRTAFNFCSQAIKSYPQHPKLESLRNGVRVAVAKQFNTIPEAFESSESADPSNWPDHGHVRRERYFWNQHEPDRFQDLQAINAMMSEVAPKLEILAVDLPTLTETSNENDGEISRQLGVFAREDIAAGETILDETSMLTANNKLQDALCDACSADLPDLDSSTANETTSCEDCEVVFCSEGCFEKAMDLYHPALCGMDVEAIAKDVPPAKAADSLYSLLLLRALAMAETQQCHPLELNEVKYIWGDFHNLAPEEHWSSKMDLDSNLPKTLPFSFENNIRLPFHMLEKMDIDIFANPQYDVWVFNTLYAKFRGTASARLSGLGGRAIRGPEVSAVHPMWCMANHSCDPNVSWEWGGSIKFWAREERVVWERQGERGNANVAGIKEGEEVLNHYCDVELPVQERREWARGALGGNCRCARCLWEANEG